MTPGVLILTGPTAAGKTRLALALAKRFDAEIVGADSRQIYRGMTIGTAAPTQSERDQVTHHCVEFLDPHERYSAARFTHDALRAIDTIVARGRRALVVGGTGFYVRALCGDVTLSGARDDALRARIVRERALHPIGVLHEWLATLDPSRAAHIAPHDGYRIGRALEIALLARDGVAQPSEAAATLRSRGIVFRKCALEVPMAELEPAIAARVDAMLREGLLEEAERVGPAAVAADAVGYPQAFAYLRGWLTRAELRMLLVRATRRYAKRQATWFRSEPALEQVPRAGAFAALERVALQLPGWL